ncbi:MAG TPA: alpha-glucan family phosphorylase, partial [Gemmatimonadaceae bacterium]|nr:alpha-glucan family phosphorylase [Gemmatimonadaceae bacterium]
MAHPTYNSTVAYFSMEICLEQAIPTYSGGLGVLAGDTLRSAADLELPVVAVTLLHRKGYFQQQLDASGNQSEQPVSWSPEDKLEALDVVVSVTIEGREVHVRPWKYQVRGVTGHVVPVLLLDTALPENSAWDQTLTDYLYGGDTHYRLCQEVVLGMGGAEALRALGYDHQLHYHMNEGHAALATLTLLERQLGSRPRFELDESDLDAVERHCIFTTHTPVPAGHDKFPMDLVRRVLGDERCAVLERAGGVDHGQLNMTHLALHLSRFVNGVAMRHRDVSKGMFPNFPINSVTNGVHAVTWAAEPVAQLFDRRIPEWRRDNLYLRYAVGIPLPEVREAHKQCKTTLLAEVQRRAGVTLDPDVFTIGFARRATPYKRADLLLSDPKRLAAIARKSGGLQLLYAGKAHPRDEGGKALIRRIFEVAEGLKADVPL